MNGLYPALRLSASEGKSVCCQTKLFKYRDKGDSLRQFLLEDIHMPYSLVSQHTMSNTVPHASGHLKRQGFRARRVYKLNIWNRLFKGNWMYVTSKQVSGNSLFLFSHCYIFVDWASAVLKLHMHRGYIVHPAKQVLIICHHWVDLFLMGHDTKS